MVPELKKLTNLSEEERVLLEECRNETHKQYLKYIKSSLPDRYMSGRYYGMYIVLSELLGHEVPRATMD